MILTDKERQLIEAVRELDEPCANILLWYTAGLENAQQISERLGDNHRVVDDQRKIDIANKHMRLM